MRFNQAFTRTLKSLKQLRAGAAALELAVMIPLLMLIALGVSEFGRLYFAAITVANAARTGAQYGVQSTLTSSDTAAMNASARNEAADIGTITATSSRFCRCPDGSTPSCTGTCSGYGGPEVFVQVSASKTMTFLMNYPGLPASVFIRRTAVLRVQ